MELEKYIDKRKRDMIQYRIRMTLLSVYLLLSIFLYMFIDYCTNIEKERFSIFFWIGLLVAFFSYIVIQVSYFKG